MKPFNLKEIPTKQWIKAAVACFTYILFIVWVGNFWWLLLLPVIFDVYITKMIPWTWWKKTKNPAVHKVFEWVDAIVFALVAVYFINLYLFQNYRIPTSSLEKTLLVGDFLFVSKVAYGARIPNTPLSFPLVQNTFPVINTKSYLEKPQWEYKRLKGFGNVTRNDIVVFNFPAGDTVALLAQNPDYYTLCYLYGRENIHNNPNVGKIVYFPVDRRENYVKRCVGLPGDTLQIIENQLFINGFAQEEVKGLQFNYSVQAQLTNRDFEKLGISKDDRRLSFTKQGKSLYDFPMTKDALSTLKQIHATAEVQIETDPDIDRIYPLGNTYGWTRDNYGPIWIPKKGATIQISIDNINIYERCIRNYERNDLKISGEEIYINGQLATEYTFGMDYYWMMGDNRHNSADSRCWGFVPEDHVVGQPVFVWLSLDKDKKLFNGGIRWSRFLRNARK